MYRNDPIIPTFALILALGLFYTAYLDGLHIARLIGHTPEELSVGQIGLMAFGAVLLLYGLIGLVSYWLEGIELRPGRHFPTPSTAPVAAGVILVLLLTALSGFFVRLLVYSAQSGHNPTWLQGLIFGAISLVVAALLGVYKKFFGRDEAITEEEKSQFPW
ncbi:MAG: cytochrome C [Thermus sp.]|uniref:cytochrome C n=1 Tax=Thermus sp. TaxID=275 RepID=UPI0025ED1261|nr:cytochrome C [Thermus sp.]MCS6867995.1 cytochrome C [Thermus sp.]MCS7218589.1 cytochrome C [Thermus sp.]MCX7848680.1 cytochrome C [Thermus sp.]MDW8016918.1 cytochrome C [Thermus sp.]MDW8357087.1 cytochrome C [Thermus sp.]